MSDSLRGGSQLTRKRVFGLTSWRSAANARDEDQNAITLLGAFVGCNGGLASMREDAHFFRQAISEMISLPLEVVAGLQIQPEPVTRAEIPREPQGAIRADGPGAMHDLVDPSRRHTDIPGQPVLRQAQRL